MADDDVPPDPTSRGAGAPAIKQAAHAAPQKAADPAEPARRDPQARTEAEVDAAEPREAGPPDPGAAPQPPAHDLRRPEE